MNNLAPDLVPDLVPALVPGTKVLIKKFDTRPYGWNSSGLMDCWMGKEVTIYKVMGRIVEIREGPGWLWNYDDFELAITPDWDS